MKEEKCPHLDSNHGPQEPSANVLLIRYPDPHALLIKRSIITYTVLKFDRPKTIKQYSPDGNNTEPNAKCFKSYSK